MSANRYGNVLTIILVVVIIAILVACGLLVYNYVIKPKSEENRKIEAFESLLNTNLNQSINDIEFVCCYQSKNL